MMNDYVVGLEAYKNYVRADYPESNIDRLEFQFESLRDWSLTGDIAGLSDWFKFQQENCAMQVSDIPLSECRGWIINPQLDKITHKSGEFFVVQGVRIEVSKGREVETGWDQPIITQVGYDGGLLGLLRRRINQVPHYLIEAKAEPGNPDKVQMSPTLQATFSNLRRAHGGRKPRFSEFFEEAESMGGIIHFDQWMSEDGGRLHLKRNRGMLVEIPETFEIQLPENFKWVSLYQLKELIKRESWVNPHIRSIISHL